MTETVILSSGFGTTFYDLVEIERVTAQKILLAAVMGQRAWWRDRSCLKVRNASPELYDELRALEREHKRAVNIATNTLVDEFTVAYTALIEKHGASLEPRQER